MKIIQSEITSASTAKLDRLDNLSRICRSILSMFRLAKVVVIMPLAVMISGGGWLSLCNVFGMIGLHPHHHGKSSAETICVHKCDHHTAEDHDIPCSDECLIELPDAEAIAFAQLSKSFQPELLPTEVVIFGNLDTRNATAANIMDFRPPGWQSELLSYEKTGRFLL